MQRVSKVVKVEVFFQKTSPITIVVQASGEVPTGGWSNPELGAWRYVMPPADGIQDFDFIAKEPTGMASDVITPITAVASVQADPHNYWGEGKPLKGVRVHAQQNSMEGTEAGEQFRLDRWVPWPWPWRT